MGTAFVRLVGKPPASLHPTVLAVSFRLVQALVEPLRPPLDGPTKEDGAQTAEENQTASQTVVWLLAGREEVRREPMRALADAICNRDQRRLLTARGWDQRCLP